MLGRLDHVAVAVRDLDAAIRHYDRVWGLEVAHRERVLDQGVDEAMLRAGDTWLQLVAPTGPESTVARFLERRGEGLHHVAYRVADLAETLDRLRAQGVPLVDDSPRPGGGDSLIAWLHPSANHGVLVELVERAASAE